MKPAKSAEIPPGASCYFAGGRSCRWAGAHSLTAKRCCKLYGETQLDGVFKCPACAEENGVTDRTTGKRVILG